MVPRPPDRHAIGDVLFGAVAPSGKLPVSFPRTVGQVPIYYGHKNTGRPDTSNEHFSSRYIDLPSSPLYPFGYGLSYTTFSYSDLTLERQSLGTADTLRANMTLTNTGQREGDEIVQLYVRDLGRKRHTDPSRNSRASSESTSPGSVGDCAFSVPVASFAFTGLDMKKKVEPGSFILWVGPSSVGGEQTTFEVVERCRGVARPPSGLSCEVVKKPPAMLLIFLARDVYVKHLSTLPMGRLSSRISILCFMPSPQKVVASRLPTIQAV